VIFNRNGSAGKGVTKSNRGFWDTGRCKLRPDKYAIKRDKLVLGDTKAKGGKKLMSVSTPREFMVDVLPAKLNADPARLAGLDVSILLNIKGDEGGDWVIRIKEQKVEVYEGEIDKPTINIKIKDSDYVKLVNGELSGPRAFMTGKLKFKGDMSAALKLQKLGII